MNAIRRAEQVEAFARCMFWFALLVGMTTACLFF